MHNLWTLEEEETLKRLINTGDSFESISHRFHGRTRSSISHKAIKFGLSNNYKYRKHFFNESFWDKPNIVNSYFGGYIAADGYIDKRSVVINISSKDISILEEFKRLTDFTGNIKTYFRKNYKKETLKQVSTLKINTNGKWLEDLKKHFNIVRAKSLILQPPNFSNDLLKFCYLIGYLDGDGWITYKSDGRLALGYVSGSYDLIKWIRSFLLDYFPTSIRNESRFPKIMQGTKNGEKKNCFYVVFSGSRAAKIIDFCRQFPIFKLDRKWSNLRVLEAIDNFKKCFSNYFQLSPQLQSIRAQFSNYQQTTNHQQLTVAPITTVTE